LPSEPTVPSESLARYLASLPHRTVEVSYDLAPCTARCCTPVHTPTHTHLTMRVAWVAAAGGVGPVAPAAAAENAAGTTPPHGEGNSGGLVGVDEPVLLEVTKMHRSRTLRPTQHHHHRHHATAPRQMRRRSTPMFKYDYIHTALPSRPTLAAQSQVPWQAARAA
jgi:hypothetical protein